jgi:hypothetical protein
VAKKTKSVKVPAMDYPEHERTYENFIKLFKWSTIVLVFVLILMAMFLV